MNSGKKQDKNREKRLKKQQKAELKSRKSESAPEPSSPAIRPSSPAIRYAEFVRGCLYVLTGGSLAVALVLGQRGAIVSLDDVIESLFAAIVGKVVLALIALGFLIHGLKYLNLIR